MGQWLKTTQSATGASIPQGMLTLSHPQFSSTHSVSIRAKAANGKLRDELLDGEIFDTLLEAKVLVERWRCEYNRFRPRRPDNVVHPTGPHSLLGYGPPAPEAVPTPLPRRAGRLSLGVVPSLGAGQQAWSKEHRLRGSLENHSVSSQGIRQCSCASPYCPVRQPYGSDRYSDGSRLFAGQGA